jgi:hypothetical protein
MVFRYASTTGDGRPVVRWYGKAAVAPPRPQVGGAVGGAEEEEEPRGKQSGEQRRSSEEAESLEEVLVRKKTVGSRYHPITR